MNRIDRIRHWWNLYKFDVLAVGVLFFLAGVPRLYGLGAFLTADEKNWIGRSYEFVRAFKDFRFNEMLQTTHPGVTTLWLVGVSVAATIGFRHIPFASQNLRHFVVPAQLPAALLNTLAVPAMYLLLRKLLPGRLVPFLAAALVALDPFIIGYSRVAHVDALLMSFLWLAALSMLCWANQLYDRRYLVLGGVLSGLAILTKVPAIFILPFLGLILLVTRPDFIRHRWWLHNRGRDAAAYLLLIAVMVVFIWPALLFVPNPQGNVLTLKRDYVDAALIPHDMTENYSLNVWHYPAALLARATPQVQFFALVLGVMLAWELLASRLRPGFQLAALAGINRRTLWLFWLYIFFFMVMMTLGAKKGDRYILPVWPALDTLGALGVVLFARGAYGWMEQLVKKQIKRLEGSRRHLLQSIVAIVFGFLVLADLARVIGAYHPYEIAYSNPLFPDNLSQELGWGEGLDQVGAWLTSHAPEAVVASWYPEELRAYTSARVIHINGHEQNQV
ncbi:MAG: phospholipid carrier-dependent glycosyltransferase, partial [Candidatus Andersenbacteria bacterium]|nr:phospholipid carrier-dependent glycosyltransferase [Candidatus Andersenbacteria bacterium]